MVCDCDRRSKSACGTSSPAKNVGTGSPFVGPQMETQKQRFLSSRKPKPETSRNRAFTDERKCRPEDEGSGAEKSGKAVSARGNRRDVNEVKPALRWRWFRSRD